MLLQWGRWEWGGGGVPYVQLLVITSKNRLFWGVRYYLAYDGFVVNICLCSGRGSFFPYEVWLGRTRKNLRGRGRAGQSNINMEDSSDRKLLKLIF